MGRRLCGVKCEPEITIFQGLGARRKGRERRCIVSRMPQKDGKRGLGLVIVENGSWSTTVVFEVEAKRILFNGLLFSLIFMMNMFFLCFFSFKSPPNSPAVILNSFFNFELLMKIYGSCYYLMNAN